MRSNEINKLTPRSRWLYSEVQAIEGELANSPISQKKYLHLTKKLDVASRKIQDLEKTSNVFIREQTKYLKEKVITLSKDLIDRHIEAKVSQIQKESFSLKRRISQGAIKKLETQITRLERDHKTSIPHRRILADAKYALLEAKAQWEGKSLTKHFDWLATQKNMRLVESTELLPGEVEELFDIAKAIYDKDFRQAKMRYNLLSEDHKRRFLSHMRTLAATPFVDFLETMQALIATANELVENGESYPSSDQIDQLFLGLSQITEEEKGGGKIVSFKSKQF